MVKILLIALVGLPLFAEKPCFVILGKTIEHESGTSTTRDTIVSELAVGLDTQIVRVTPKDSSQPSWVEKRYFTVNKFGIEAAAYEKLGEILSGPGNGATFKMVKAEPQLNQTIILEDVKGVPIDKVLEDPMFSEEIKGSIRALYRMKLKVLDRMVRERYPDVEIHQSVVDGLPSSHYIIGDNRNRTDIFMKSSQIVVTFDEVDPRKFYMTIVDGY